MHVCPGGDNQTPGYLPQVLLHITIILEVKSLKFTVLTALDSKRPPPTKICLLLPHSTGVPGIQGHTHSFYMGAGDLFSGFHICLVGTLLTLCSLL